MNKRFKKVAAVFASTVMLSSTIAFGAAADMYPEPFVSGSSADVALVWGGSDSALQSDFAAVTDISTSLSGALTTPTSTSPSTVTGGDFVQLEKSSNKVNLGDDVANVFGTTVDDDDLSVVLADGTYLNDENTEYDFEQKLSLGPNLDVTHFADSSYNDKEPTVGIHLASNKPVLNYTLDFTTDPESDVVSGELADIETTDITILGKSYYVLDADNSSDGTYAGKLTLLDSANTAIISEGETETVSVGDESFDVSINFISSSSAKIEVGGEVTNSLAVGETYKLSDGTYVGIKDILYNSKDTGISKVELSLGSGKLEISAGEDIELNDDDIDGVKGWVHMGSVSGQKQTIDKIVIEWSTDEEEFIAADSDLVMPGFEALKLSMGSFVTNEDADEVTVDYDGDDSIQLMVPVKDGDATFNILYSNAAGELIGIGKDTDERLATSNESTITFYEKMSSDNYHSWFVATYQTGQDSESYLLSATISESDNRNRTTITNEVTGEVICKDKTASDSCDFGDVSLRIDSVNKTSTDEFVRLTAGSNVEFDTIYTAGGMKIQLPYTVAIDENAPLAEGAVNLLNSTTAGHSNDSFGLYFDTENKDDDNNAGNSFNVTIDNDADGDLHIVDIDTLQTEHEVPGTDDDVVTMTTGEVATTVTRVVSSDKGKAVISYPGEENYAEIFITESATSVSGGDGEVSIMTVTDAEADTVSDKNLVVVGGSCINTVAADLLSVAAGTCGEAWEAQTGVGSGEFVIETFARSGGKVATLVAGYNAGDTTNAAKYLTTADDVEIATGKKYVGTTATEATLMTA